MGRGVNISPEFRKGVKSLHQLHLSSLSYPDMIVRPRKKESDSISCNVKTMRCESKATGEWSSHGPGPGTVM